MRFNDEGSLKLSFRIWKVSSKRKNNFQMYKILNKENGVSNGF